MKKIKVLLSVALLVIIIAAAAAGCQTSPAAVIYDAVSVGNIPESASSENSETTKQLELNGVIVTIPADWQVETSSKDGRKVIRLFYSKAESWGGPWIEISPAAEELKTGGSISAASLAGGEIVIFRGFGVKATEGCTVDTAYIPSKNVMVSAGYRTSEQCDLVTDIFSGIQFAD